MTGRLAAHEGFRWYLFLAAFLILPNLPLLLAGGSLNLLESGYVDLDYLVVALLALALPRAVTFLLLLLAVLADFVQAACVTYLFAPSEFLVSLRFGGMLSTTRTRSLAAASALVVLCCAAAAFFASRRAAGRPRRLALAGVLLLLLLLALLQAAFTRGRLLPGDRELALHRTPIRIPSLSLLQRQWVYYVSGRGARLSGMRAMPSASALALGHLRDHAGASGLPDFVQIVVESWGLANDQALAAALLAPYADPALRARYRVLEGAMPFDGPTTSGEARELCQTYMGFNYTHGSVQQMSHCLPLRFRAMGYSTLALHGFQGAFYDRQVWYPRMGFQDIWFEDRFREAGLPECAGPFPGTCDDAVARWLGGRLEQPRSAPLFVHWVTLNSHLPVPVPAPLAHPASCAVSAASRGDASICSWYQLVAVVQDSVVSLALRPLSRPAVFVIVGDHAPPFDRQGIRGMFSSTQVPYVILLPRN